jgi:hypothetical protein
MELSVVLHESAVRCEVGGRIVMGEQLQHLVEMSQRDNITIRVLPNSAGSHPGNDGAFSILGFPEPADPDVVYVQYRRGGLYLEDPSDIADYIEVFNHLVARALNPDASQEFLQRLIGELG